MGIDDCPHTFQELAQAILPKYMDELRRRMAEPVPMTAFAEPGVGPVTIARRLGRNRDFSGCYVHMDGGTPFYVGISRSVLSRLRSHVVGRGHEDATLAYSMAYAANPHQESRSQAIADPEFKSVFDEKRAHLKTVNAAFVEIDNAFEMHVFEAYCALELDTYVWNTFATH